MVTWVVEGTRKEGLHVPQFLCKSSPDWLAPQHNARTILSLKLAAIHHKHKYGRDL